MQNPRLAARYAKSLLDLAVEQNSLEATLQDVLTIDAAIRGSRELAVLLKSPVVKADKKNAIVEAVFGTRLNPLTRAFVKLLTAKGREGTLAEMATSFMSQYRVMKHISPVKLVTATPVHDTVKESIRQKIAASMPGQSVEMTTEVRPELIGGFLLEMGGSLVDASVKRDLQDIKKQFTGNLYVPNIR